MPVTLIVWLPRVVKPRPLLPVPSELKLTVTLPPIAPAVVVFIASDMAVLLPPDASMPTDPLETSPAATLPKLASSASLQPSLAAVLATINACAAVAPTWTLPKPIGLSAPVRPTGRRCPSR